jgi:hypothetical protein
VLINVRIGFVDRKRELVRFRHMLTADSDERILLILEQGERGKTYLLLRMFDECEQRDPPVPVILLDFDQRRSGLTDYLGVAREIRRQLGDDDTPDICACEEIISRRHPLVNVQTGIGDGVVDFGRRGRFSNADISDVSGRDSVEVNIGHISGGVPPADLAQQRSEMGRALRSDLARLAGVHDQLVVLVDTFEDAPSETCEWLERWLFEAMRYELAHIRVVVAGRPQCHAFFAQPRLWTHMLTAIHDFDPFSDQDILFHFRQRGLLIAEEEIPLLLDLARASPAQMALVGDWLEQSRRGRDEQ